jgi:hypothetical protein
MENGTTVAIPSSRYNDFLFTIICEEPNGTQLSVLSALTRADIDPWEEAARLSAMTEPIARSRLISVLNHAGNNWSASQRAAIATRLIGRLPSTNDNGGAASAQVSEVNGRTLTFLVCWWSFAMAIAVFSSYQQRVHKTEGVSTTYSSSTTALKDLSTDTKATVATD